MSKFYPWTPDGSNLEKSAAFEAETQRLEGFKSGDTASSAILNTALCQSNLIAVALVEALQKIYTNNDINATTKGLLENADIDSYKATMNQLATLFATSLTNAFAKANSVYYHKIHFDKSYLASGKAGAYSLSFDIYLFDTSDNKAIAITKDTLVNRLKANNYKFCSIQNVKYYFQELASEQRLPRIIASIEFYDDLLLNIDYFAGLTSIATKQYTDWHAEQTDYRITVTDNIINLNDVLS